MTKQLVFTVLSYSLFLKRIILIYKFFWKGYNYYLHSVSLFSETKYIQPWNWYREDFKTDNKSRSITLSAESESDHKCRADCLFSQTKVSSMLLCGIINSNLFNAFLQPRFVSGCASRDKREVLGCKHHLTCNIREGPITYCYPFKC